MLHRLPLQASESQFEFKSTNGTDDRTHFKLMLELLVRVCFDVGPRSGTGGVMQLLLDGILMWN